MVLGTGEDWRFVSIFYRHADGGHVLEGALPDVLRVDLCVGGLDSEGVRMAGLEIQRLPRPSKQRGTTTREKNKIGSEQRHSTGW